MYCYLLELSVILNEEEYNDKDENINEMSQIIFSIKNSYQNINTVSSLKCFLYYLFITFFTTWKNMDFSFKLAKD